MKKIVLFGAGKSATCLIAYLTRKAPEKNWQLTIVDTDPVLARSKAGASKQTTVVSFDINNQDARRHHIADADLVISMLPAQLHIFIAKDCIHFHKHLLTASYLLPEVRKLDKEIKKAGILFMGEMGLDPGIDHMSAMNALETIRNKAGQITAFKSFCGALIAPESDNNPWHYKISWSPASLITAGMDGAIYRENGIEKKIPYDNLFGSYHALEIPELGELAYYPNRNSLPYAALYQLENVPTILRATLRHPAFCEGWQALVALGLTSLQKETDTDKISFSQWAAQNIRGKSNKEAREALQRFLQAQERPELMAQFGFLGLFSDDLIQRGKMSNGDLLLSIVSRKLMMQPEDKDMVVMLHRISFEQKNTPETLTSYIIVKGEDHLHTAIAKTVGLPLGILADLLLSDKIKLTGLHIPIMPEVYKPVLRALEKEGIRFKEYVS